MINPDDITTVRVGELPPALINLTDNIPHEIGTDLFRTTVQDLADLVKGYIGTVSSLAFNPTTVADGGTLPATATTEWLLVGMGTFHNVAGFPDITTTEELNALVSNGTSWSIGVEIPINVELAGIVQTIRSGYLQTTPSEDAVYNALALKANISDLPDATTSVKGKIKLAGDLGGTADLPTVPGLVLKADDSNVIHKSGNETFTGLKSGTSNGATATTGFSFTNSYNGGLTQSNAPFRVIVSNNGLGYAGQNDGAGTLFLGFNTSTGSLNRWDSATGSTGDLLRMSKNSVLTAFINHLGELTVPKINVSGETASTIAGFDSFKNIFSLPTATYPSLTELAFLKGVTSSIQAQINAKQNTLTNPVTGLGTTNYIPKFTGPGSQAISQFFDNGTMVGIGTNSPNYLITSYMTGNNYFQWTNANTGTGGLDGLLVGVDTLSAVQIINRENTIMSFWCNNAIILRLFPSGGVSIGSVTDPGANNLSVAGNITATTYAGTAALTGVPTAPTATVGTNTTQIATTAFVQANARPYKVYMALLTQTGTSAPTATVLENTLGGSVVWTRTGVGIYVGTLTGAFTVNKTAGLMSDGLVTCKKAHKSTSVNVYQINTLDASTLVASDNQMSLDTIEIRVYN